MAKSVTFRTLEGGEFKLPRDFCEQHDFLRSVTPSESIVRELDMWSEDFKLIIQHYRGEIDLAKLPPIKRKVLHKYVKFSDPEMERARVDLVRRIKAYRKKLKETWFHTYGHKQRLSSVRKSFMALLSSMGDETLDFMNMTTDELLKLNDSQLVKIHRWFQENKDNFR